jgi:cytochrome oxidase Cu insertion factor (SCO1/SenC/PrrC family)
LSRSQIGALSGVAFILVVSVAWWALALWPAEGPAPEWVNRARWVCFNAQPDGLPGASGWLLLIGQPIGMLAAWMAISGQAVRSGIGVLAGRASGRALLAGVTAGVLAGLGAAGIQVSETARSQIVALPGDTMPPETYPRLDREAPALGLRDHAGELVEIEVLRGRPTLLTFAFGNCETVCPAIVHQTLDVQRRIQERAAAGECTPEEVPRVVILSLDPWRDTPSRLSHLAMHWEVGEDAHVLSGSVEEVEAALTRWNVARERDPGTGDVVHPPLVYVLDREGRIAYATAGGVDAMVELLGRG